MLNVTLIIPDAHRAGIEALGAALGWGGENYTVALGPSAAGATTHWGCWAPASPEFLAALLAVKGAPPAASQDGTPMAYDQATCDGLVASVEANRTAAITAALGALLVVIDVDRLHATPRDQFANDLAAAGLVRVVLTGI